MTNGCGSMSSPGAAPSSVSHSNGDGKQVLPRNGTAHDQNDQNDEDKAICDEIERKTERKKDIISSLLLNSHRGYGNCAGKAFSGIGRRIVSNVSLKSGFHVAPTFSLQLKPGTEIRTRWNVRQRKTDEKVAREHWTRHTTRSSTEGR